MKKLFLVVACVLLISSSCYASRHPQRWNTTRRVFPHRSVAAKATLQGMFVFGDSIVDPGNNNNRDTSTKANHLPYGYRWEGHQASGRFSDGKLAVDLVAEHLGLPYPPPISSDPSAATHGMNFGSASSGILDSTGEAVGSIIPLSQQVDAFVQVAKGLAPDMIKNSIFYVSTGNNDMVSISSDDSIISQLESYLERLYDLGARKFVVPGILSVGCVPMTQVNNQCTDLGKSMTTKYNTLLQSMLQKMKQQHQDLNFVYANIATIMDEVIADPASAGMTNVHNGCCSGTCAANAAYCSDSSKYMFWDFVHPTQAFNTILAERWYSGADPYVTPMNIAALAAL